MGAAANAHDVERHVGFYAHDSSVISIFNGQATIGWDAIRENQDRIWRSGKSVVGCISLTGRREHGGEVW
jgi:hypothetical protein